MINYQLIKKYSHKVNALTSRPNPLFIIFVGIPGAGKTTYAKYLEMFIPALRVATDDIKLYYIDNDYTYTTQQLFQSQREIFHKCVKEQVNIISDSNSATKEHRNKLKVFAKSHGYTPIVIYCCAKNSTIRKRINQRKKIKRMKNFYISQKRLNDYTEELEPPQKCIFVDTEIGFNDSIKIILKNLK